MPQVTFFLLAQELDGEHAAHLAAACQLAAQSIYSKQRCLVWCDDKSQAEALDELLWQLPPERFVPHNMAGEGPNQGALVEIAWQTPTTHSRPVLINLATELPQHANRYRQIYDFVPAQEDLKQQARERYKHYRAAGFALTTQPVSSIHESQNG